MIQELNYHICKSKFADLDIPVKCDSCLLSMHAKRLSLSVMELKGLSLKNRNLKFFLKAVMKV